MRTKLEELVKIAKTIREAIEVNEVNSQTVHVSTWIRVTRSGTTFHSISFLQGATTLDVTLYKDGDYVKNNVIINVEEISDEQLDEIITRSKADVVDFIAKLDAESAQRRLARIEELKTQLAKLEKDVSTS